jgi:hypothetical protein
LNTYRYQNYIAQGLFEGFTRTLSSARDTFAIRTIKILSDGHFQWIAFNLATKEFSGTGGGTYPANNGVSTENMEFFSQDDSRLGASLEF